MKFGFKFSNLCGSVYKKGNLVFTADGNSVLSPVGNRISVFDLVNHKCYTLPFENVKDIARIALAPNGYTFISIDEDGRALLINLAKRVVLCEFNFQKPVLDIKFSPDSKFLAVTHGSQIQVWRTPPLITEYRPFVLYRTFTGHYDDVTCLEWSADSLFLMTGSKDMSCKLFYLNPNSESNYIPLTLTGHRGHIVGAFFGHPQDITGSNAEVSYYNAELFTVSKDGALFIWQFIPGRRQAKAFSRIRRPKPPKGDLPASQNHSAASDFASSSSSSSFSSSFSSAKKSKGLAVDDRISLEDVDASEIADTNMGDTEEDKQDDTKEEQSVAIESAEHANSHRDGVISPYLASGRFSLLKKVYFNQDHAKVQCVTLHRGKHADLLVVGFSSGVFSLYELTTTGVIGSSASASSASFIPFTPLQLTVDCNKIHSLSISSKRISTVAINASGEWLAFGSARLGQLLVWEWQSETYVLKQQGHFFDVNTLAYSPDGQLVVTGGDDGKVKLWNTSTGFCFVTFHEHSGPVTAVEFSAIGNVVFSASLDGTVRAYDLVRYRQFRTMTSPQPAQFISLAVDPSGEVVCAGSMDPFEIYVWSLQTGRLLDVLAGHEGPVAGLSFTPASSSVQLLASCSWDKTVRLWEVFSRTTSVETLHHKADVLAVAFRPDGKELCCSALDGQLYIWDVLEGSLKNTIEGRRDLMGGRLENEARTAASSTRFMAFTSLCYSADGTCIIAGGNSKFVCIYELSQKIPLRKFQISHNRSLDGVTEMLNSRYLTEAGPLGAIDDAASDDSEADNRHVDSLSLPGVKAGDFSSRKTKLAVRSKCVRFSPTGRQWAAASTEGLLLFSLDEALTFDPADLDMEITRSTVMAALEQSHFSKALGMALRLNEKDLILLAIERTPADSIPLVARSVPVYQLQRLLTEVAKGLHDGDAGSPHLEFYLLWCHQLLTIHGAHMRSHSAAMMTTLRTLQKNLTQQYKDLGKMCNQNQYLLEYLAVASSSTSSASPSISSSPL